MTREWILRLKEYIFSTEPSELKIEDAITLKKENIPKRLFKFRAFDEDGYSLKNLEDDTVWCSNASEFNDPYDSSLCFTFENKLVDKALLESIKNDSAKAGDDFLTKQNIEVIEGSQNPLRKLIEIGVAHSGESLLKGQEDLLYDTIQGFFLDQMSQMNKQFSKTIQNGYKICSFSERIDSILMWSHYSKHHQGFAIEYDFNALPVSDMRSRMLWPVFYDNNLFDASSYFDADGLNNFFGIFASIHKAADWGYENEWRLVLPFSPNEPPLAYSVPSPVAVYLGSKISNENQEKLISIAELKGIQVLKMELKHNEFKMIPQTIE